MPSLTWALVSLVATTVVSAAPAPWDNNKFSSTKNANIYSGAGGQASGGSVSAGTEHGLLGGLFPLLNVFSNDAGNGGNAASGNGLANLGHRGLRREQKLSQSNSISSSAYTGAAGQAFGGSSNGGIGLVNVLSNNGGDGGSATSGNIGTCV